MRYLSIYQFINLKQTLALFCVCTKCTIFISNNNYINTASIRVLSDTYNYGKILLHLVSLYQSSWRGFSLMTHEPMHLLQSWDLPLCPHPCFPDPELHLNRSYRSILFIWFSLLTPAFLHLVQVPWCTEWYFAYYTNRLEATKRAHQRPIRTKYSDVG